MKIFIALLKARFYTNHMNLTIIIIIAIAGLWFIGAFLGFISGVPKTFKNDNTSHINAAAVQSQTKELAESTEQNRKKMMDDMRQKISDGQRRY